MGRAARDRPTYRSQSSPVYMDSPMRRCGSMNTHRASIRSGSRHTRCSSSRRFADGRSRGLAWRCPVNVAQFSVSRRVESWPWLWGFGIQMCTVRSSAPRLAAVTSHLSLCRVRFHAHTSWPGHRSRSSWETLGGGRTRYAMQVRIWSCRSELDRTEAHSGKKSSR